jgi:hybrid cluster-associated redox disulfide protein
MERKITGETPIRDLLTKYPKAAEVFAAKGMACLGCAASMFETVEQGAAAHGIDLEDLLEAMNEAVGG